MINKTRQTRFRNAKQFPLGIEASIIKIAGKYYLKTLREITQNDVNLIIKEYGK